MSGIFISLLNLLLASRKWFFQILLLFIWFKFCVFHYLIENILMYYRYKIFGKALERIQNDSQVCFAQIYFALATWMYFIVISLELSLLNRLGLELDPRSQAMVQKVGIVLLANAFQIINGQMKKVLNMLWYVIFFPIHCRTRTLNRWSYQVQALKHLKIFVE